MKQHQEMVKNLRRGDSVITSGGTVGKVTKQAAIIADLTPDAAQKLCAAYQAKKLFCEVKKPTDFSPPFSVFWREMPIRAIPRP